MCLFFEKKYHYIVVRKNIDGKKCLKNFFSKNKFNYWEKNILEKKLSGNGFYQKNKFC